MSSIARPPDPCLVAVVLIVRSRAGPRFVFHYPPAPSASAGASALSSSSSKSPSRRGVSRGRSTTGAAATKGAESASSTDAEPASSSDNDDHDDASRLHSHHQQQASNTGLNPIDKRARVPSPSPLLTPRKSAGSGAAGGGTTPALDVSPAPAPVDSSSANVSRERRTESSGHGSQQQQQAGAGGSGSHSGAAGGGSGGGGSTVSASTSRHPPWDTFLGLKTDVWEKLLCPPSRVWHKRRFEVGVNDLAFVGWPVFAKGNGAWRRRYKKGKKGEKGKVKGRDDQGSGKEEEGNQSEKQETGEDNQTQDGTLPGSSNVPELGNLLDGGLAAAPAEGDDDEEEEDNTEQMSMFNVVFVLNPSILEYHVRLKEKYDNVVKKFGKGLKLEQSRADYVRSEAQKILQIKEKAREDGLSLSALYSELLSKSSLAQAISTVYSSISNSKIASVTLTPQTTMSLQVPPLTSTASLPSMTEPSYPGLWLTTADSLSATDEPSGMAPGWGPSKVLAKHFALLLLSDEATILKDIESSMGSLGSPLAHYVRYSKPNKSFAQISTQAQIPLSDIQVLANHLIYWRRARAIPPLNQRDTYIVSPNADMSKLRPAAAAYEAAFPTLPSLPKMLAALSGTPRPYSSFIPSRDHKQIYLDILAWLMRGGWVTQLRAFGWIKVDVGIKKAVAEAIAREDESKEDDDDDDDSEPHASANGGESQQVDNRTREEDNGDNDYPASLLSSRSEASGDLTPIPGRRFSYQHLPHHQPQGVPTTASLIPQPQRASPLESRWLDEILARISEAQARRHDSVVEQGTAGTTREHTTAAAAAVADDSLQKHWPQFVKYFNGTDALEKIPVREGLKRNVVWRILSRIDASSSAATGAKGPAGLALGQGAVGSSSADVDATEKVLLTVRHW